MSCKCVSVLFQKQSDFCLMFLVSQAMKIGDNNVIESKGNAASSSHLYQSLSLKMHKMVKYKDLWIWNFQLGDKIKENHIS